LIMKYANKLKTSAPERIGFELKELFSGAGFIRGFEYFVQFGLFNELFPELTPVFQNPEINQRVQLSFNALEEYFVRNVWEFKFDKEDKIILRLALLLHLLRTNSDITNPAQKEYYANFIDNILTKLKEFNFPVNVKRNIKSLLQNWDKIFLIFDQPTPSLYRINKLFSLFKDRIILLITFSSAFFKSQHIEDEDKYRDFLLYTEEIYDEFKTSKYISSPLLISGKDLLDIGYEEGLEIGRALHLISKKFEAGEITDYNAALDYAEDILAYRKSPTVRYKIASYFFIIFLVLYSILGFIIMKSEKKFQNAFRILDTMGNRKEMLNRGIAEIQAAIKFFPYDYRYYSLIAECYQVKFILGSTNEKTIMIEKMLRNRQRAIDLAEALPYLSADLGKTYEILGDLPMALLEYNRAMEKNPLKLEYRMKVIELFKRRGDYKFARDVIEEGLFLLPENKKLKMELEYVRGKVK
ncbi:hypothetical protein KAU33_06025, partial [Candidatus Dependentiae bacterium]|nr:hypothetical protein [Candidatus Dependentiae bacterium]